MIVQLEADIFAAGRIGELNFVLGKKTDHIEGLRSGKLAGFDD